MAKFYNLEVPSMGTNIALDTSNRVQVADTPESKILELLGAHNNENLKGFLRDHSLPTSGTKNDLLGRLEEGLRRGDFQLRELVELLNEIESWGKQHIFLFSAPGTLSKEWRDGKKLESALSKSGRQSLLEKSLPLVLPDAPTLSSVEFKENVLRLLWVEKRVWQERLPDEDREDDEYEDVFYKAYKACTERGVTVFEWDLVTSEAMLKIRQLSRGANYTEKYEEYKELMSGLIDLGAFDPLPLSKAIKALEHSDEVRSRQLNWATESGGTASFKSSRADVGYKNDNQLLDARNAMGENIEGVLGNFYWLSERDLTREIHTTLHGDESRVGIGRQDSEMDIRYVLSRVRHHCR